MASPRTDAQILAQTRLQHWVTVIVAQLWNGLLGHDQQDVPIWLGRILPVIRSARRQSVALTDAYLAHAQDRAPLGLNPDALTLRNGADLADVYRRPFVTTWAARNDGRNERDALDVGRSRAMAAAAMDVGLAQRAALDAIGQADGTIFGFKRVANPDACDYCRMLNGVYVKSAAAMPLHPYCRCTLEPLDAPHPLAARLPSGVAVRDHGELGPTITDPGDRFTGPRQIPAGPVKKAGEAFQVTTPPFGMGDETMREQAEGRLRAIESVHVLPENFAEGRRIYATVDRLNADWHDGGQMTFRAEGRSGEAARFVYQEVGLNSVAMRRGNDSTVHELGHVMDAWGLGDELPLFDRLNHLHVDDREYHSGYDPDWEEWRQAVRASDKFAQISSLGGANAEYGQYLSSMKECWARSYEQWILSRTDDPILAAKYRIQVGEGYPEQIWGWDDFAPIAQAIENLFRRKGLLGPEVDRPSPG